MSEIKRINPRRPYLITPAGLRRIVLGDNSILETHGGVTTHAQDGDAKPVRAVPNPERWHMAIAHSARGRLDSHAREAIAAAAILANSKTGVVAVVLGDLNDDLKDAGADKIAVFPQFDDGRFLPDQELAVVLALIGQFNPAHIFIPDAANGDGDLGRRLIESLGEAAATHVKQVSANQVSISWSGHRSHATAPLPRVVLLDADTVDLQLPFAGAGELIPFAELPNISAATASVRDLGLEPVDAGRIALEEADFIVAAGNGVDNVQTIATLADLLGAAVGASRVAVDDGKYPRDKQIGASGKTVSASTYVAVGISGAVQHLQGIKDCRHVIAINRDAGAPIVKRADLTVIGDAEDVMQALIMRVSQARNQREQPEKT